MERLASRAAIQAIVRSMDLKAKDLYHSIAGGFSMDWHFCPFDRSFVLNSNIISVGISRDIRLMLKSLFGTIPRGGAFFGVPKHSLIRMK